MWQIFWNDPNFKYPLLLSLFWSNDLSRFSAQVPGSCSYMATCLWNTWPETTVQKGILNRVFALSNSGHGESPGSHATQLICSRATGQTQNPLVSPCSLTWWIYHLAFDFNGSAGLSPRGGPLNKTRATNQTNQHDYGLPSQNNTSFPNPVSENLNQFRPPNSNHNHLQKAFEGFMS